MRFALDDAMAWYDEQEPGLAALFLTAVIELLERVGTSPQQWGPVMPVVLAILVSDLRRLWGPRSDRRSLERGLRVATIVWGVLLLVSANYR